MVLSQDCGQSASPSPNHYGVGFSISVMGLAATLLYHNYMRRLMRASTVRHISHPRIELAEAHS